MQRRRICIASWAPFLGGAEVAAERLAVGLQNAGHEVFVLLGTQGESHARMERAGIAAHVVPMAPTDRRRPWRYLWGRLRTTRLLSRLKPDVLHANDLPTSQMVAAAAGSLGIPRVCHHRWVFGGAAIDWLNKHGAERHLFVSHALMNELCENSARLAASPRAVAYDGLLLPEPASDDRRTVARRILGLPQDKQILLFAGQIIERKGVADLLRAWSLLAPRWRNEAELRIVGDDMAGNGAYRREMESLARELACPVEFMGFQRNVDQWLAASNIVLVPSHVEPLGNATLEAMSYGLPVIGGRAGGIPEMIADGQTGILVPPHSPELLAAAMERLLSNQPLARQMGQQARERCEKLFSLSVHVQEVLGAYQCVLEARK